MDEIKDNNLKSIIRSFLNTYGIVDHIISSINDAYDNGIPTIITDQFKVERTFQNHMKGNKEWKMKSDDLESIYLLITATKAIIDKPIKIINDKIEPVFPNECKKKNELYGGMLRVDYKIEMSALTKTGETLQKEPVEIKNVKLGKIPIVVKSNKCNIANMSKSELLNINENPKEEGGEVINGDNSYVIDQIERTNAFSRINTYYEVGYSDLISRAQIISKPGIAYENSYEVQVIYKKNKELNVKFAHTPFTEKEIPFYVFFRLLGVTSDIDLFKYILCTDNIFDDHYKRDFKLIQETLTTSNEHFESLKNVYNPIKIRNILSSLLASSPSTKIKYKSNMFEHLDKYFLPHLGTLPEFRYKKCLFLGRMIKRCFDVEINHDISNDRDSIAEKYIETPGHLFANNFKTLYNKHFILFAASKFEEKVKTAKFENIDLIDVFKVIVTNNKLESKIIMSLNTGNADIDDKSIKGTSRYTTQKLYPKSDLGQKNTKRIIRTAESTALNKSTRTNKARATHPSYSHYIDITQTNDTGPTVGLVKAIAIMSLISNKGNMDIMKYLLDDKDIINLTGDLPLSKFKPGTVMFNGDLVGFTDNICKLRNKYINLRRERKIERFAGIHCNVTLNELDIRVDDGRPISPFLIVYNNKTNPELFDKKYKNGNNFEQKILFTLKHYKDLINNEITIDDLVDLKVIEWLDSREVCYSAYCAENYEVLKFNKNNVLKQFTHCSFAAGLYGIPCLTQPFANHNPNSRTAFQAKMGKQTCGEATFEREPLYKSLWMQYINDIPLTVTVVNDFITPSGKNIKLAYMPAGWNQEDALIINRRLFDRGCFQNNYSDILEYPLESNEIMGKPPENLTQGIKSADYSKLVNGKVPLGTVITPGDVIIGKYLPIKKTKNSSHSYLDKSIIYSGKHKAVITSISEPVNSDNIKTIKIQYEYTRYPRTGDKMSSRHGQKGVINKIYPPELMPFTEDGQIADIVFNTHGIPSRKTAGQMLDGVVGEYNAIHGIISDETVFSITDIGPILDEMSKLGYDGDKVIMYDGATGEKIKEKIAFVVLYYQRIQKSPFDSNYAISNASKDIHTHQPKSGQKKKGGVKFGEMETQCKAVSGGMRSIKEYHTTNSDAMDIYACRCGSRHVIVNKEQNIFECKMCDNPSIVELKNSYTTNLVLNTMTAMGIDMTYKFD